MTLTVIISYGQTEQDSVRQDSVRQDSVITIQEVEEEPEIKQLEVPAYKLYPTENLYALIKLDTRTGKTWQVHYGISSDDFEGTLPINDWSKLSWGEEEVVGRFALYPTQNMYNFILVDQVDGRTWQVQWNNERDKRFISRIY